MPFIQNVSMDSIKKGNHKDAGQNSVLIQIVDPCYDFPNPSCDFPEIHQFEFFDAEGNENLPEETFFNDLQASQIINILKSALENDKNVIVHCHAGLARSGAVAEVGIMMGFDDTGVKRIPNQRVKRKLLQALKWYFDPLESAFVG